MRPQRAEPLVRIAKHYLDENNHALAYIFAKRATELPVPTNEKLTLDLDLYEYQPVGDSQPSCLVRWGI